MGSFVVSWCLTLVRSSLMLAMVISRNCDSLAKERDPFPLSPWFHWLRCGRRLNDGTCKNDKTSKTERFQRKITRLWDSRIHPKSNLEPKCIEVSSYVLPFSSLFTIDERGAGQRKGDPWTVHLVWDKRRMQRYSCYRFSYTWFSKELKQMSSTLVHRQKLQEASYLMVIVLDSISGVPYSCTDWVYNISHLVRIEKYFFGELPFWM